MDYQKKPPIEILELFEKHGVQFIEIEHYAWPQLFSSTSGPREGIGCEAFSKFTIEAWVCDGYGPTIYCCNGMYSFDESRFEPFKRIDVFSKI